MNEQSSAGNFHGSKSNDELDYVTDIVGELSEISRRAGLETLAVILALAQVEATRERARRRAQH